ncbi:restriction endonuclease subunit S [uncultured Brachyspira sp.]|uniref:restriction endonuclease subunit S n=1 Tax=uncultured Brachyspira sp. TaxID=221953 RepID=UPI002586873B|nr:restriction endonuclease subunit S [uncultured Brachyspira sp.]
MNKLPDGWEIKKLKDILSNEKYSIKRGPFGSSLKKEFFIKEGVKVFEQYNPINNDPHWCRYRIDKKKYEELKAFSCRAGDFLISCSGTLGKILLLPDNVEEGIINQALLKIRLNNKLVDNYYFLNLFQYEDFQKRIYIDAVGSAIHNIASVNILKEMDVIIPPLDEQKRIASVLSKIDAYLENTIKLIEEKERFKRGIAKKLLTCKEGENIPEARFKGFEDEWEIVKLGDIGTITATGVDKKINDNETPIKLLNYLDVFNRNKLYEKEISYMTTATEKQLEKCNIRKGDLFITPSSEDKKGIAKSSVAMEDFKNTVYSYHIIRVRFNKEIDLKFKSYMCDTDFFHRQAYRLCDGSGQRYFIKLDNFRNMEICIPKSIKEQEKIGGYLSLLDKEIDNLKKQKELIKEMKRGAMQKLLSGEVRLLE